MFIGSHIVLMMNIERKRDEYVLECERSSGELQLDSYFGDLLIQRVVSCSWIPVFGCT